MSCDCICRHRRRHRLRRRLGNDEGVSLVERKLRRKRLRHHQPQAPRIPTSQRSFPSHRLQRSERPGRRPARVSVAQLAKPPQGPDPYNRRRPSPGQVFVEGDDDEWVSYEIEKLLARRLNRQGRQVDVAARRDAAKASGYGRRSGVGNITRCLL